MPTGLVPTVPLLLLYPPIKPPVANRRGLFLCTEIEPRLIMSLVNLFPNRKLVPTDVGDNLINLDYALRLADNVLTAGPGCQYDSLQAAVDAAEAVASAAEPQVVTLAPGMYTLEASLIVPPYVTISSDGGAIINGTGGSKGMLLMQSHSRLKGVTIDMSTTYMRAINLEQDANYICTDVWIEDNKFINGHACISCEDIMTCNLSHIHIVNNDLCGDWAIRIGALNAAYISIIGNTLLSSEDTSNGDCLGLCDIVSVMGLSYGHVIANNTFMGRRIMTSKNFTHLPYMVIITGWGNLIVNNTIDLHQTFITPIAGASATYKAIFYLQSIATLPASGETVVRPNVITGNTIRIQSVGDSTANSTEYRAIDQQDMGSGDVMPDLILAHNHITLETEQANVPRTRIYSNQTNATPAVIYLMDGGMDGFDSYQDDLTNTTVIEQINGRKVLYEGTVSATITDTNPHKATPVAMTLPAGHICRGLLITAGAPGGTAAGTKNINYSVGSAANADDDLADATDIDVMIASGTKTAASVHGDQASDNVAAYFPMDGVGRYIATDTTIYLNVLGQTDDATGQPKTVTAAMKVYALLEAVN